MKVQARITGGKVHEVGYRIHLLIKAIELGCERFFSRNQLEDGRQLLLALTESDEFQIEEFKRFGKTGRAEGALVEAVAFEDFQGPVMSVDRYIHYFIADQLNKGITALLRNDRKEDEMLGKQDNLLETQEK